MPKSPLIESLEPRTLLASVAVDLTNNLQTIKGLGADFAKIARNGAAPVSDSVGDFELANLKPTHARVPINIRLWEPTNDDADPYHVNSPGFPDFGNQTKQFNQIKDLNARGIPLVASVFDAPNWMVSNPTNGAQRIVPPSMYPELAESMGNWLLRVKNAYGVTIPYVSLNEGNGGYNLNFK